MTKTKLLFFFQLSQLL